MAQRGQGYIPAALYKGPSLYGGSGGGSTSGNSNGNANNNPLGGRPLSKTSLYADIPGSTKNESGYAEIPGSKPRGRSSTRGSSKEKSSSSNQRRRSNTTGNIGPRTWGRDSASTAHGSPVTPRPAAPAPGSGAATAAATGPRDSYDAFTLVLLERLAIGDVGFFTDADLKDLQAKGLMAPGVALKASSNRGFLFIPDLKDMAKTSGAKSIQQMEDRWPLGCQHLMGKKHLKQLKSTLAARKKDTKQDHQQGADDREGLIQKQLEAENERKRTVEKENKEAEKAEAKLEKERQKQALIDERKQRKASQARLKEEEKQAATKARALMKNLKKSEKQAAAVAPQEESRKRRDSITSALKAGASTAKALDNRESTKRWMAHPAHTRYKVITALNTKKPGYLQLIVGDLVTVTQKAENGYFTGILARNQTEGIFPGHHVQFAGQ